MKSKLKVTKWRLEGFQVLRFHLSLITSISLKDGFSVTKILFELYLYLYYMNFLLL